jgi:putative redox protein
MSEPAQQATAGTASTAGTGLGHREVSLTRTAPGEFEVRNSRGGSIRIGGTRDEQFRPVELLLAAIAGCSAIDVDAITGRRAEPESFEVRSAGEKVRDDDGNHMADLQLTFTVRFPEGPEGDEAREMLPKAIKMSHDRLCTVSRTVILPTPIATVEA